MRHGIVLLPQQRWAIAAERWRRAEEYGFDHAWTYDHLSWRSLADQPWYATIPTLTAAATVTSRIGLGLFVASPNFRHPVPFAKELATLDDVAGGRLLVGIGSGGTGFDAFVLGQSELTPAERHARFIEFVRDLDVLLRFEEPGSNGISFEGEWFTARDARMVGVPTQSPRAPLLIAGNGPRAIRFAAGHGDGWITTGGAEEADQDWWSGVAELSRRFQDAYAATGRTDEVTQLLSLDSELRFFLRSAAAYEDAVGRASELGFTDVISHWPREEGIYAGSENVLDEVAGTVLRS